MYFLLILLKAFVLPLSSQPILVLGDSSERAYPERTSSSVLISSEEIDALNVNRVDELLRQTRGIQLQGNGAFGKATSFFIRGTDSRHTLVLIDGVRSTDVTAIGGGSRLEFLNTEDIEEIEILKGSQSVLYGSEAIGGVIKIKTRSGKADSRKTRLNFGVGSFGRRSGSFVTSIPKEKFNIKIFGKVEDVEGYSAFNENKVPIADDDGYGNQEIGLRIDGVLGTVKSSIGVDRVQSQSEFDDNNGDNTSNKSEFQQTRSHLLLSKQFNDVFKMDLFISTQAIERDILSSGTKYLYKGNFSRYELLNTVQLFKGELKVGAVFEQERVKSLGSKLRQTKKRDQSSAYSNYYKKMGIFFGEAGLRLVNNQFFDNTRVYRVGLGLKLSDIVSLKASHATGFKSPSLFQNFGTFGGNIDLKPENSRSNEVSILFSKDNLEIEASIFENKIKNFIDYDSTTNNYLNFGSFLNRGYEASFQTEQESLSLKGSYTFLNSRDLRSGAYLARRARHIGKIDLDFKLTSPFHLGIGVQYVGKREEPTGEIMPRYVIPSLRGSYNSRIGKFLLSIGNLVDKDYEEVRNFPMPGLNFNLSYNIEV